MPILELYHTRISESLDAFETLSSFLVRAVPGALGGQSTQGRNPNNMTSGVEGTQRLVKAYVSAKWMAAVMATWGEDLVSLFLHFIRQTVKLILLSVLFGIMAPDLREILSAQSCRRGRCLTQSKFCKGRGHYI